MTTWVEVPQKDNASWSVETLIDVHGGIHGLRIMGEGISGATLRAVSWRDIENDVRRRTTMPDSLKDKIRSTRAYESKRRPYAESRGVGAFYDAVRAVRDWANSAGLNPNEVVADAWGISEISAYRWVRALEEWDSVPAG